jgi:hypothetical protein
LPNEKAGLRSPEAGLSYSLSTQTITAVLPQVAPVRRPARVLRQAVSQPARPAELASLEAAQQAQPLVQVLALPPHAVLAAEVSAHVRLLRPAQWQVSAPW